jgi:hypothetical protein
MLRPLLKTLAIALTLALAAASVAAATSVSIKDVPTSKTSSFAPGAKPQASVKLRKCRSAAYYDNRLIRFRALMSRFSDTNEPQKLEMRLDVWQKLDESPKFKKLKADGLGDWTSSTDSAAAYQRDLVLVNVETAASYKARIAMRWVAPDGTIEWHRTLTSTACRQKTALPKLTILGDSTVPVPGSSDLIHTIKLANRGRSEAINVGVGVALDGAPASVSANVDSVGPGQSYDLQLRVPACSQSAKAILFSNLLGYRLRPIYASGSTFTLPRCN